jgi:hypothetical protein
VVVNPGVPETKAAVLQQACFLFQYSHILEWSVTPSDIRFIRFIRFSDWPVRHEEVAKIARVRPKDLIAIAQQIAQRGLHHRYERIAA